MAKCKSNSMKIVRSVLILLGIVGGMEMMLHPLLGNAQDLSLEEIMNRHFQACNMEARQQVQTIVMTGLRVQQDLMPLKIYQKRPDKFLMEFDVVDLTAYQGYDGDTAWSTAPWTGNPAPRILQGEQAAGIVQQAGFDGMLWDWKSKGYQLTKEGTDTIDGHPAWKLKLMLPDSSIQHYFIDSEDFLLKKRFTYRTYQGQPLTIETVYSDYRKVNGIPFAYVWKTIYPGRELTTEIEDIVLNVPVDEHLFDPHE